MSDKKLYLRKQTKMKLIEILVLRNHQRNKKIFFLP